MAPSSFHTYCSLPNVTIGLNNTAIGSRALAVNISGTSNTASGALALQSNTSGVNNTASGFNALFANMSGANNTATGQEALRNTIGNSNTAIGSVALRNNTSGNNNIAIGSAAGSSLTGGSDNIYVGNLGVASESATIRIGTSGIHTSTFIAGIRDTTVGVNNLPVVIDSTGRLGTGPLNTPPFAPLGGLLSSRRFKEDIHDMGEATTGLLRLRPVTFRYNEAFADGARAVQYGLIAEEVAEVYPDLVGYSPTGEVETVQYHKLVPMLLNELQKQHRRLDGLQADNASLKARLDALERLVLSKEALTQK